MKHESNNNNNLTPEVQNPPYELKINRLTYTVSNSLYNGTKLLELAGLTPTTLYCIYKKLEGGGSKKIEHDEDVDLSIPGIERFYTIKKDLTEGFEAPRLMFKLTEDDHDFLRGMNFTFETVNFNSLKILLIFNYKIPDGYNIQSVTLLLKMESNYPDSEIDMFYVSPYLQKLNGNQINALTYETLDGKSWQRWSRHRTSENAWRPGIDGVRTHLDFVNEALAEELKK